MRLDAEQFFIKEDFSIKQAMKRMTDIGQKALFMVGEKGVLEGSLSDGDVRKWILSGGKLNEKIWRICNKKPHTVKEGYDLEEVKRLMLKLLIESVPVVNKERRVVKILTWEDVFSGTDPKSKEPIKIPVVIMAGGKGTRLDPFTRILPKPLIPIGDKPIIELIMDRFNEYGVKDFFVSVNHKARMIKSYFEDSDGKYKITYLEEKKPLGTAGGLKPLKNKVRGTFLLTNCDVLIDSDCGELVKFHGTSENDITLVVSCRHYVIPYGICEIENGGTLKNLQEKPGYDLLVNTGMYVINKDMLDIIPKNKYFNMNDLIEKAKRKGKKIGVFPISESSWVDIGQWEEYRNAIEKMRIEK